MDHAWGHQATVSGLLTVDCELLTHFVYFR